MSEYPDVQVLMLRAPKCGCVGAVMTSHLDQDKKVRADASRTNFQNDNQRMATRKHRTQRMEKSLWG